jgi:hypothetical protein
MDSVGHLLRGCDHPHARGNKILRHDGGVKIIQKAISKGPTGGFYMIMDAGKGSDLPEGVMGKRIPQWLLPDLPTDTTELTNKEENARRKKLRPDILIIEGLAEANIRGLTDDATRQYIYANRHRLTVHIIEVGYCGDLNHESKDFDKRAQHAELVTLIRSSGLTVKFHDPVTLGRCGSIPVSFITMMRHQFGLSSNQAETAAFNLNRHAVQWVDKMYTQRQQSLPQPG